MIALQYVSAFLNAGLSIYGGWCLGGKIGQWLKARLP